MTTSVSVCIKRTKPDQSSSQPYLQGICWYSLPTLDLPAEKIPRTFRCGKLLLMHTGPETNPSQEYWQEMCEKRHLRNKGMKPATSPRDFYNHTGELIAGLQVRMRLAIWGIMSFLAEMCVCAANLFQYKKSSNVRINCTHSSLL